MSATSLQYPLVTLFSVFGYFISLTNSVTLTPNNPSTSFASISLISDDDNTQTDGVYRCNISADFYGNGETSDFCVQLNINTDDCDNNGEQVIQIEINLARDTDDTDIVALFGLETSTNQYSYISVLSAYDGQVNNGASQSSIPATNQVGTAFAAPLEGSENFLTYNGNNIGDNFLDSIGTHPSAPKIRAAMAGGNSNNYELLASGYEINEDGSNPPIRYTMINNLPDNYMEIYFSTVGTSEFYNDYYTAFPVDLSVSDSYTILFGADNGIIEFESFEVTSTCTPYTCSCDSLPAQCRVSGDPHFTTFDGKRHHFQGGGEDGAYYDYVTECRDSSGDVNYDLPFNIAVKQSKCNGEYTCIREVLVELDDGTSVTYPSGGGTPVNGNYGDATGTFSFPFNSGTATYTVSNQNFEIEFPTVWGFTTKLEFGYLGTALNIKTCDCSLNLFCGLCGKYNNNRFDDFTRCDNGEIIDDIGTSSFRSMTDDAWQNTLDFGDSCCREDLDENSICPETTPDDVPLPSGDCLDNALDICQDTWNTKCTACNDELLGELEFLEDCIIDVCAAAGNNIGTCQDYDCADEDWIKTSEDKCNVDCNVFDVGPCSCETVLENQNYCRASGDPHFTTFDGIRHHFQGGGENGAFYDYVTECRDSNGDLQDNLPFNIVAKQSKCNALYTCIEEVLVELDDGLGTTISYPSLGGIPTNANGDDARGTFSFTFNDETVTYTVERQNFEIEFTSPNGDDGTLEFGYYGTALNVRACDCLSGKLCGICGAFNGDGDDDFTRCDDGSVIDHTGSDPFWTMTVEQWANTLDFGDSCCRSDLDQNGICPPTDPGDVPLPASDCLEDASKICQNTWDTKCTTCTQLLEEDEFLADCEVDVCAAASNDVNGCETYDCADPIWLVTSEDKCLVDCDIDGDLTCECDSLPAQCRVSGDPHFTTFDGKRHHFQGGGSDGAFYDYVTECRDENGDLENNLPFNIVAKQSECNGAYTCIREVLVELDDGLGTTITYPSDGGFPTDAMGGDARGSGSFSFNGVTVTYTISSQNFEIEFTTVNNDDAKLEFSYLGTALNIRTCDCLSGQLCGLCGTYNDEPSDDFTRCDNGEIIDSSDVSSFKDMTDDAWQNTLDFGDSCCRVDLGSYGECPVTTPGNVPLPEGDCLDDAYPICLDTWNYECTTCDQLLDVDEFLVDCVVDVCAAASNDVNGCEGFDCAETTWIQTSVDKCNVDCDIDGILGTKAPSEEPTAEPLPL